MCKKELRFIEECNQKCVYKLYIYIWKKIMDNNPTICEEKLTTNNPNRKWGFIDIYIYILFELTKKRGRRYPAKTITDDDYANDIAILANTPNQAETLVHSLEQAAARIGLHVNAHKTKYMCFNQTGDISTLDGTSLKLVDKFTYLGSSVSSTEKDIGTRLTKAWTAIDKLSISQT